MVARARPAPPAALRALLALLLVVLGLALTSGSAAAACACKPGTFEQQVKRADVIFVGAVDEVTNESPGHSYAVTATHSYAGTVDHTTEVQSLAGRKNCGLGALKEGRDYVFLATGSAAPYQTDACSGTATATSERVDKVAGLLGEGEPVAPPPPPEATMTRVEDAPPLGFARLAAPGAAAVLLGVLGLFVVRRLARR